MQEAIRTVETGSATRCLGVHIAGTEEPVLVPLLTELPRRRFRELTRAFAAVAAGDADEDADELVDAFFAEYLGAEAVGAMNNREYLDMVRAWSKASEEDAGASLGE